MSVCDDYSAAAAVTKRTGETDRRDDAAIARDDSDGDDEVAPTLVFTDPSATLVWRSPSPLNNMVDLAAAMDSTHLTIRHPILFFSPTPLPILCGLNVQYYTAFAEKKEWAPALDGVLRDQQDGLVAVRGSCSSPSSPRSSRPSAPSTIRPSRI